jgi:hypothetical protein
MDTTKNVSAQIYFKQLPPDPGAGEFGCNPTGNVLSTCVDDVQTDAQIENAFQSQLDLSEYYKSPEVFESMKRDYFDKTMEGSNTPAPQEVDGNKPAPLTPTAVNKTVGPRDTLQEKIINPPQASKSSFGKSIFGMSSNTLLITLFILIICFFVFTQFNLL